MSTLISAIQSAGGPLYQYRQINPVNDQDGGEPGGNIRQVFMFRTDRGLSFIDRPGGTSTTVTTNGSVDILDGVRTITATQTVSGRSESLGVPINIVIDTGTPASPLPRRRRACHRAPV